MPIVGVTHNGDGSVRVRRSVTMKVAIGLPPAPGSNFPKRLDHFAFQRKTSKTVQKTVEDRNGPQASGQSVKVVAWDIDEEMTKFYGEDCREFWIVFVDDDPDVCFKTEMAWWTKTTCQCRGDGEDAERLVAISPTESERRPHQPCANHGCPDLDAGRCKPSGDLYFLLADFPALGSICKLHTGSWQSIREIRSALEDLRSVTGGRLMGVKAKLTVRLENSSYRDKGGKLVSGTKHIIGIELTAKDIQQLSDGLASGLMFDNVQKRLGARSVHVVEDSDMELADDIAREHYPQNDELADEQQAAQDADRAAAKNQTIEGAILGRTPGAKAAMRPAAPAPTTLEGETPKISDSDLPPEMWDVDEQSAQEIDSTPIGGDPDRRAGNFYKAWSARKRPASVVRKYLKEVHGVERSFDIKSGRFPEALAWASSPLPEDKPEPMSPQEQKCREAFSALGVPMLDQAQMIEDNGGDWAKVYADIEALA
jgi:hypothetical protein